MSMLKGILVVVSLLGVLGSAAQAGWKFKAGLSGRWTYDSNVFNLSQGQADDLRSGDPASQASGRFLDLNRVGDHILRPSFSLAASGPGVLGRKLELDVSLDYEFYVSNTKRNNAEVAASLRQELWKRGTLEISGRYVPKYFRRNYLIDGIPEGTGIVLPENRVYGAGIYREAEASAGYEHRLLKRKKGLAWGLTALAGAAYVDRRYQEASFHGRDRRSLVLDAGLAVDFKGGWEMGLAYSHERAKSPIVAEVLLLDESVFLVDLNHDGDILDQDVRAVENVDRSFRAEIWEGSVGIPLSGKASLGLSASLRSRTFLSQQDFDGYHGRRDKRWILGAGFRDRLGGGLSLVIDYRYYLQTSSRVDVTGDEDDYLKHVVRAGLSFRF